MDNGGGTRLLVASKPTLQQIRNGEQADAKRLADPGAIRVVAAVEGSPLQAAGLKALLTSLSAEITVVAVTTVLEEVVTAVERRQPDIAVMDVRGVGRELVAVVRQLQERHPTVRAVVIVEAVQHVSVQELMRLGVSGFFSNDVRPSRLPPRASGSCGREAGRHLRDWPAHGDRTERAKSRIAPLMLPMAVVWCST